jgi:hypothetical protein
MMPMKKKTFMAAIVVFVLLTSILLNLVSANPVGFYYPRSPPPTPIVEVIGLDVNKLTIIFSAQKSGPWITAYGSELFGDYEPAHEYNYSISAVVWVDGEVWSGQANVTSAITVSLEGLSSGSHTLEVTAVAGGTGLGWATSSSSSGAINFTVNNPSPTQTIIPTGTTPPTQTPAPSTSPSQTIGPSPSVPEFPTWTLLPLVVATIVGVLVYVKRRRPAGLSQEN